MSEESNKILEKINSLIKEISEYDALISARKSTIRQSLKEINSMAGKEICVPYQMNPLDGKQTEILQFMKDFFSVIEKIREDDAFIKYVYNTKNSADYYKVGKETFEDYIYHISHTEQAVFLNYCIDLNLIKAEPNRKCVYDTGEEKVYYIGKSFADATAKLITAGQGG